MLVSSVRLSLVLALLLSPVFLLAQQRAMIWQFGKSRGLDFTSGTPKVLKDGKNRTWEGSASICDSEGKLLFYTDGVTIWNRKHEAMPNGKGLKGHESSTQSALIIPNPGDQQSYFVFTADETSNLDPPSEGIHFSEVSMCLDNSLGDVVTSTKNTLLYAPAAERLSAVHHANGTDVWVMSHDWKTNRFLAYLVTGKGVSKEPIISQSPIPVKRYGDDGTGEMKFSPDGSKLALAYYTERGVHLLDFDKSSGKVSFRMKLSYFFKYEPSEGDIYYKITDPYGISFSPNSRFLYISGPIKGVFQFDTHLSNEQIEPQGKIMRFGFAQVRGLQLGPDGKLYIARGMDGYRYIGVINKPDLPYPQCELAQVGVDLGAEYFNYGLCLPNFISSYFDPSPLISYQKDCEGRSYAFFLEKASDIQAVAWDFADPASGGANTSAELSPVHQFTGAGEYLVKASLLFNSGASKQIVKKIVVEEQISLALGKDTVLCRGETLSLDVSSVGGVCLWQDGSTSPSYQVSKEGVYRVEICKNGCSYKDTITVFYTDAPKVDLGEDQIICDDKPVLISAQFPYGSYLWNTAHTTPTLEVSQSGTYAVAVTNRCGQSRDTIEILYESAPILELAAEVELCIGDTLRLDAISLHARSYLWKEASSAMVLSEQSTLEITGAGTYEITATNIHCSSKQTIEVKGVECEKNLYIPNVLTPNGDGANDFFEVKGIAQGKWHLEVFSRQGRSIYRNSSYKNNWDAKNLPTGIYYYHLQDPSSKRSYKGWLQILH